MVTLEGMAETTSPAAAVALKVDRLLGELETYVCGQSDIIIDYATARRRKEPISTAVTESTVQWLLHRRMNAQQQMRWTPRGAHLMLKVRCAVMKAPSNTITPSPKQRPVVPTGARHDIPVETISLCNRMIQPPERSAERAIIILVHASAEILMRSLSTSSVASSAACKPCVRACKSAAPA